MKRVCISVCIFIVVLTNAVAADAKLEKTVRGFVAAYNAHDVAAMMRYVSDDVRLIYVSRNVSAAEAGDKTQLRGILNEYFTNYPDSRSEIEDISVSGRFVSTRERAFWSANGEEKTQFALAVYELCDELICAVWYYPPQRDKN